MDNFNKIIFELEAMESKCQKQSSIDSPGQNPR